MAIGTVFYFPLCIKDIIRIPFKEVSIQAWGALFFSGLFALVLCYIIWYASVKRVGNSRTAIYDNVIPVFTVFFAYIFLGEKITMLQAAGAL
jgi:drug/metabolite transporter (DMT)-like permease